MSAQDFIILFWSQKIIFRHTVLDTLYKAVWVAVELRSEMCSVVEYVSCMLHSRRYVILAQVLHVAITMWLNIQS